MSVHVLIAEDHADSLDLMVCLLQAQGYRVTTAPDGESALAAAAKDPPDLILCDLRMPRLSGLELAARIRQDPRLCVIPLVAVTASAMPAEREHAQAAGFSGWFSKPIEPEAFVASLGQFLTAKPGSNRDHDRGERGS